VNRNTKVCLLTNVIPPYYRGVFEHLWELVRNLKILVSTPMEPNRNWSPEWGDLPVTVQKCWTYTTRWRHEQGFSDKMWRHIPYDTLPYLLRERPDVVISIQLGVRTLQAALYRKLFPKSRLIIWTGLSEHTEKGLPRWRILQRKALLRAADAVLVNGTSGQNYLLGLGVPRERIFPEPYCAEISSHLALPIEREPNVARRMLCVGQLTTRKGLQPFLDVLSEWLQKHTHEKCEFWIAGDGPLRQELERIAPTPQLQLRFLGSISYEKLPEVYAQGGVFVFPTLADEWGVVVNESLAAGLPILGSLYSQAVEELVEDGLNGWTFRPDHREEMYAAIDRAMAVSKEQLDKMRRTGRECVRSLTPAYGAECFLDAIEHVRRPTGKGPSSSKPFTKNLRPSSKMEAPTP
jgi:glycosyltransferase involved in cell wall biosynthesis